MIGNVATAVFDIFLTAIGYTTARILLPTPTFGKVKVDALSPDEAGFNWLSCKRLSDSVLLCDANSGVLRIKTCPNRRTLGRFEMAN